MAAWLRLGGPRQRPSAHPDRAGDAPACTATRGIRDQGTPVTRFSSLLFFALAALPLQGWAHTEDMFKHVDFEQRLGSTIPRATRFVDDTGRQESISDASAGAPLVLVLGYLDCPNLCATVLAGASEALLKSGLKPGSDYHAAFISIDPRDDASKAAARKVQFLPQAARPGWRFLTGSEASIDAVARAIGFRYVYDKSIDEYAHPAGFVVVDPQGKVS